MCEDGACGVTTESVTNLWEPLELDLDSPPENGLSHIVFVRKDDPTKIMVPAFSSVMALVALLDHVEVMLANREDEQRGSQPFLPLEWVESRCPDLAKELTLLREAVAEHMAAKESGDDPDRGDGSGAARSPDGGGDPGLVHP